MKLEPKTVVGSIREGDGVGFNVPIRFEDLREDIQIALQNSDRWEHWQERAVRAEEAMKAYKATADDLSHITKDINYDLDATQHLATRYETALIDIRCEVDSLKWAQKVAAEALDNQEV